MNKKLITKISIALLAMGYYLDDRSTIETVFKDKVFDFNMNLGLRFTIGE